MAADQVQPFMAAVFPDGTGPFQQDNAPCHAVNIVQEWFEEHDKELQVLTWPPNSPDFNPIQHLWDVLEKQVRSMEALPRNFQDLKDLLLTSWCQIPQEPSEVCGVHASTFRAVLVARGDLHDIRKLVLMLWLISICGCVIEKSVSLLLIAWKEKGSYVQVAEELEVH
ncbi:hypothetical protein LDENG_00257450, partial [Lucifuga dentata]